MSKLRTCILVALSILPSLLLGQAKGLQLMALGGVFSPSDDEIQNVYGDGPSGKLALAVTLSEISRLKIATDLFKQNGDPFYQSDDFNAGDAADLSLTAISLAVEVHPLTPGYPRLYFGAGVDYVFAKEEIIGQKTGNGGSVGAHFSIIPEIRLGNHLSLLAEVSYRFLEITFKSDRDRYEFNLSGANLLIGLGYDFGR